MKLCRHVMRSRPSSFFISHHPVLLLLLLFSLTLNASMDSKRPRGVRLHYGHDLTLKYVHVCVCLFGTRERENTHTHTHSLRSQ